MKLVTTTSDFDYFVPKFEDTIAAFEGTPFKHLDISLYDLDYEGSQFMSDNWPLLFKRISKIAERINVDFLQAHSPKTDYLMDDPERAVKCNIRSIEVCSYLGIDRVVVHTGRHPKYKNPDSWEEYFGKVVEFYRKLIPTMEKYNVMVLAENYLPSAANESRFISGVQLRELYDTINHPLFGICWDTGHANLVNPDEFDDILTLGESLRAVHIQDNFGFRDDHIAPLLGTLDIDSVIEALVQCGFAKRDGLFTFEGTNLVSAYNMWPNYRHEFNHSKIRTMPSVEVKKQAEVLLYEIGKSLLTAHGLFEE